MMQVYEYLFISVDCPSDQYFFAQSYAPVHALSTISNVTQYASGYIQFIIMLWNNTIWAVHNFLGIIPCMTYERI